MRHIIRTMDNVLIKRINQRLNELGKAPQRVSIEATGAKETLRKILDGTTKSPRLDTIQKLADALETTPEWLTGQDIALEAPARRAAMNDVAPASVPAPQRFDMPNDIAVRGTAAGSHLRGAFQFTSDAIDFVRRPPALLGARDIYALYVEGSSMEPQYFPGDLIYVHPHRPPRFGDVVVVQVVVGEGEMEATLGVYSKRTEKFVTILKRNPANSEVQIKRESVQAIHKVLTVNELFGI